jgi:hypothetical protein
VRGPGGPTGDKINARLSDYEFVQQASAVHREGVAAMQALNDGRATIVPKFAGGGFVGTRRAEPVLTAPHYRSTPGGGGNTPIVINITGGVWADRASISRLSRLIVDEISRDKARGSAMPTNLNW